MSVNPIDPTNTDKPTGNLEELFRHHMAEAAVPPRPMLWDQIDNSLLLEQNATYRRRLTAMRWVAAASLLLASLTGTGWLAMRDAVKNSNRVAIGEGQSEAEQAAYGPARPARTPNQALLEGSGRVAASGATATRSRVGADARNSAIAPAADGTAGIPYTVAAASAATRRESRLARGEARVAQAAGPHAQGNLLMAADAPASQPATYGRRTRTFRAATGTAALAATTAPGTAREASAAASGEFSATSAGAATERGIGLGQAQPAQGIALALGDAGRSGAGMGTKAGAGSLGANGIGSGSLALGASPAFEPATLLSGRIAALAGPEVPALPLRFAAMEVPADDTPAPVAPARAWQFGASYAAGLFQPNTNFSRVGTDADFGYNAALGANSATLSEAAAAEHRDNLRPGSSQRLAVRATRRLGGRLALSTGAELSQSYAKSASTMAFVGEQVPDFGPDTRGLLRTTNFRYRTAGIPVEVRYADPVKRGWSAYGRVGAVVSALLRVRAEVEGIPEATRSYSITSSNTPYRRVLTNVRGAGGVQFRPADGNWTATLGPVAEVGLLSLNAHPAQGFFGQSRAYSVGLEAGVEFGRGPK